MTLSYEILTPGYVLRLIHRVAALDWALRYCSDDAAKFREDLMNIARTTLSSKILTQYKDHFANLAVTAVLRLKVSDPAYSRRKGGILSELLRGGVYAVLCTGMHNNMISS